MEFMIKIRNLKVAATFEKKFDINYVAAGFSLRKNENTLI